MSTEPLFWYRPRTDGGYEGPLHNGQIEDVRKASGAWAPLFAGAAPVSAEPVDLPKCPFHCGWDGLHKIAVQDAAYLAKFQWPEGEEGVSMPKEVVMRSMDSLIQVCRTMLNAAPVETPAPAFSVGVHGVGVIDDNPSALAVYFNAAPNDDDIRALHEIVSGTPVAAQEQPEGVTLDGCLETLFRLGEYLGVDYAASRKSPGAPSDVYIKAIEEKGFKARDAALEEAAVAMEQTSRQGGAMVIRALKSGSEAQQPVSGADGLRVVLEEIHDWMDSQADAQSKGCHATFDIMMLRELRDKAKFALDHLPDATKMVPGDQFRDAAQMIEPCGNSGELDELAEFEKVWLSQPHRSVLSKFKDGTYKYPAANTAWKFWQARAALAQQDAMLDSRIAADMAAIVETLDEGEWVEHIAKTDIGQRLERHITQLVGNQQDVDPLQGAADWLVNYRGFPSPRSLAQQLGIGYNRASRLFDAARKEQA